MRAKRQLGILLVLLSSIITPLSGYIPSFNPADPVPLFSTMYPFWFFSLRQKDQLRVFDYTYPLDRFSISITPFIQQADRGRDQAENNTYLGNLPNGRWNMLGLFWDPPLRNKLFRELSIQTTFTNCRDTNSEDQCSPTLGNDFDDNPDCQCDLALPNNPCKCYHTIVNPRKRDTNKEFGYFSIPTRYRKSGVRLEGAFLLVDRCFYSLGLLMRTGVANVKNNVVEFTDLTCQALGTACPAFCSPDGSDIDTNPPAPQLVAPPAVTPPFVSATTIPPCSTTNCNGINALNPLVPSDCLPIAQKFQPCSIQTVCFPFDGSCKKLVIEKIMKQKHLIADILKRNFCSYNHTGFEDLRVELFYRHLFVKNDENAAYPRYVFMPFATVGAILPMDKQIPNNNPFAISAGSNGHFGIGASAGCTLDFLSTIDIGIQAGVTHFFARDYCDIPFRTHIAESGIFPYKADICLEPGRTAYVRLALHGYHYLDLLSTWVEYIGVMHTDDNIKICRSFIPPNSCYFDQGYLVKDTECNSSWSSQFLRLGFNYDLSPHMLLGFAASIPLDQRNAFNSGTLLGSLTFIY